MRLREGFITHETALEHITVTAGQTAFNGMIRSNRTAGYIVECLKNDVTTEEIIEMMFQKYDASKKQIKEDVERILKQLYAIGAIDGQDNL